MKKIILVALTLAAGACAPMRPYAAQDPSQTVGKAQQQSAPAPTQTAQPEAPAPAATR